MKRPVALRRAARDEFEDAIGWYESKRPGLGLEFADAVEVAIERIVANPARFRVVFGSVRRAVLRRFPYAIYFVEEPDRIVVIAVFHGARAPGLIKRRG